MASRSEYAPRGSFRAYWAVEAAIILAAFVLLCFRAQDPPLSQTALSRLATVLALTEDDSWYIDRPGNPKANPFELRTIDKVEVEGRLISSKPPLLPLLMTWEYRALSASFRWTLDNMPDTRRILYAFTLTFCIIPWTAALFAAASLLRATVPSFAGRTLALLALAFGTQVFGFGAVFNNHVPAAAALVLCLCLVARLRASTVIRPVTAALAGLAGGLTSAFDVPNAIYVAALGLLLMPGARVANVAVFALAASVPVLFQGWLLFQITGSPEPVQLSRDPYLYESSYWRNPLGVDALSEPKGAYLANMTVGNRGIFLLYPVLIVGLAGAAVALKSRTTYRNDILAAALCFLIVLTYYTANTANYGGEVYGMRWLIPSMPVLVFMGHPVWKRAQNPGLATVLALALALSAYSAWRCGLSPWSSGYEWPRQVLGL